MQRYSTTSLQLSAILSLCPRPFCRSGYSTPGTNPDLPDNKKKEYTPPQEKDQPQNASSAAVPVSRSSKVIRIKWSTASAALCTCLPQGLQSQTRSSIDVSRAVRVCLLVECIHTGVEPLRCPAALCFMPSFHHTLVHACFSSKGSPASLPSSIVLRSSVSPCPCHCLLRARGSP